MTSGVLKIDQTVVDAKVAEALAEDSPTGDVTVESIIPADLEATATLMAREPGVMAGEQLFAAAFRLTDPRIEVTIDIHDGASFAAGDRIATVRGPARGVLTAERVGLNFVQRLSGIATLTAAYVAAVSGTRARILDTRKTTPTLRVFERHAVACGGGTNHRFSLSHGFMAKDNHLAVLAAGGKDLSAELQRVKSELAPGIPFEVEVDRLDQIDAVLAGGADIIMLDNFSLADLMRAVSHIGDRARTEASGGVNLTTVRAIAETGVDTISVGALTHSAPALDLGLDINLTDDQS
jgi:nicotinate-nucleotide pyrophosphorylase (carboxylating)